MGCDRAIRASGFGDESVHFFLAVHEDIGIPRFGEDDVFGVLRRELDIAAGRYGRRKAHRPPAIVGVDFYDVCACADAAADCCSDAVDAVCDVACSREDQVRVLAVDFVAA